MTTTDEAPAVPESPARPSRTRWLIAAAAVVVAAVAGTTVALTAGGDSSPSQPKTVQHLALAGGGPAIGTCIRFSVDILRDMPVAFSGTAAEVTENAVLIDVDHWYQGGSADQVQLDSNNTEGVVLEGGVNFTVGQRYLVSASDGTVSMCGYSGEWSAELEQSYQEAFGS